jgi:hypothetical protein
MLMNSKPWLIALFLSLLIIFISLVVIMYELHLTYRQVAQINEKLQEWELIDAN